MPSITKLLVFIVVIVASWSISKLVRLVSLPLLTGYIFFGMAVGPYGLDLILKEDIVNLRFVQQCALALIGLAAGGKLYKNDLRGSLKTAGIISIMVFVSQFVLMFLLVLALQSQLEFLEGMSSGQIVGVSIMT